jgi:hypothetical protein
MKGKIMNSSSLPLRRNISTAYTLSLITAALMTLMSLVGFLFSSTMYPFEELRYSSVATDIVNVFIVLPVLLGSMVLTRRGKLIGLLFWPGALFIVTYHYLAYAIALTSFWQSAVYVLIVLLSVYTIYRLLSGVDSLSVQEQIAGKVPERFAGSVLAGFGILFFFWRGSLAVQSMMGLAILSKPEFATAITDAILAPAWVIVGVLLWRKQAFGYISGGGLLFQFNMLFIGLYVYFALQPILAGVPFPINDFFAVFVMGLVCLVPFILFTRGILNSK